ncbi:Hsp20/alpha crystallin family protein [Desulfovibrio ferrophilus]|uniref:Heat shock protein Hsp20 n=1 Tax=Desulfovibrio ferrophilus TaxID=241368 RepID=A0A2Z6B2W7_9BACT|nr:Hsp20/alpha crystallin family protein [Desulfovibrio ferrophilus]BBD09785.1 heat shock protein Hsp20 [Desulfovibrio ferrophilus]
MAKYDDNPWIRLEELAQGTGRIAEGLSGGVDSHGRMQLRQPVANVLETADGFVIEVELPGVRQEDVTVELTGNKLAVIGEVHLEKDVDGGVFHIMERSNGPFGRRFVLPQGLDGDHVNAVFAHGLLTLTVPKKIKDMKKTIRIEISE